MGRKGKICVPKLLDGLMGHLPPESASPGFCPLPSVMQSGVLLGSRKRPLLGHKGQAHLGWNPSHSNVLPFLGGSISWSRGFAGKGQLCPETPRELPAFSLPGCNLL